ncbi:gag-pol polyprotein [Lasius niger]|uniref:Gag-pol polyprotein n=1 Tax=Lasius niger TaxID=67767 RepID=A0A0J7JV57_LASNI|nr:gag-pol polyprotein [Lasius niger]
MEELKIPKLDGENYTAWSIRTRAALVQKNCWDAISPGYGDTLNEVQSKNNEKALTFLFLVVEDQFLFF